MCGHYTRVLAGAEFDRREAALLDPLTGLLNRTALMSRFEELRQQAAQNGRPIAASFGVGAARGTDIEFEKLFRAADQALYAAKTSGRNTVVVAAAADSRRQHRPTEAARPDA